MSVGTHNPKVGIKALAERVLAGTPSPTARNLAHAVLTLLTSLEAAGQRYGVLVEAANEVVRRAKRPESFEDLPLVPSIDRLEAALLALEGREEKS